MKEMLDIIRLLTLTQQKPRLMHGNQFWSGLFGSSGGLIILDGLLNIAGGGITVGGVL